MTEKVSDGKKKKKKQNKIRNSLQRVQAVLDQNCLYPQLDYYYFFSKYKILMNLVYT